MTLEEELISLREENTELREQLAQPAEKSQEAFVQPGVLINSSGYSGMTSAQAASALFTWFEERGKGQCVAKYRLRD